MEERKLLTGSIYPENITYEYPGFRTTKLGCSFGLIKQLEGTKPSLWVKYRTMPEPIFNTLLGQLYDFFVSLNNAKEILQLRPMLLPNWNMA